MSRLSRRVVMGGLAAAPLAMPGIIRAQSSSKPVKIGLLSDMSGPYRDVGGTGNKVATELAIAGFRRVGAGPADRGHAGRRPGQAGRLHVARPTMDRRRGCRCAGRRRRQFLGPGGPAGVPGEEEDLSHYRPGDLRHDRQAVLARTASTSPTIPTPWRMAPATR